MKPRIYAKRCIWDERRLVWFCNGFGAIAIGDTPSLAFLFWSQMIKWEGAA